MRRIIFLIAIFLLTLSPLMGQTPLVTLPEDGNWPTIVGDSIMLIGPQQEALTEEQRYFNPPYLLVYPGKEHLKEQMIRAGLCDCDPTKPNRRIGVFSIAPDKQVSFSQGNLQYLPAANIWKFANTQYEYLGNANKYLKPTFRNWVDLFGWSANNTTAPFGVSTSTNAADYAGTFVDWGINTICGDAPNTWRTLSIDEWKYLYHERPNAEKLFALGTINGIAGMILLPDDWQQPEGVTCKLPTENGLQWNDNYNGGGYINTNTQADHYQNNIYTVEQWQTMEEVGAVFLPAAGYRENTNFSTQSVNPPSDYVGSYATSTITDGNNYYFMRFIHREVRKYSHLLYRGRSVRLVHDTILPKLEPGRRIGVFSVAKDKQVSFSQGNLQYVQSRDEWRFAENQYDFLGDKNLVGEWIDLFDWQKDDAGNFIDWGKNIIQNDVSNTWRTLSHTEWKYLLHDRSQATKLIGGARIEDKLVLVILPDNWVCPADLTFVSLYDKPEDWKWDESQKVYEYNNDIIYNHNRYDANQWQQMEKSGAVAMPATGYIKDGELQSIGRVGRYWSSTPHITSKGYYMSFGVAAGPATNSIRTQSCFNRDDGHTVRLVHDTIVPKPEPEYVDLGLSVKWATFNVGATSPEDYGVYFAWGETEPKETYSWATYKWCDGTQNTMTKYNSTDGKTILEPADDAAQVHWGGNWRMPTEEEQQELIDRCSWERTNLNGVIGYKVTGPNGNSIFIPIAGAYNSFDNQLNSVGSIGWIYSSTIATEIRAYEIHIEEGGIEQRNCSRCVGLTIRPVYDDRPPKRIGVFSVAADKQVSFSQGNLQYIQSTDTWQFAANQLEYMGHKHYRNGQLADTIEYFGWSGKNSKTPWGISLSIESSDYAGEFLDWGTNTIAGSAPNTWRTLSNDEWLYICQGRKNADQLLGLGTIGTVTGLIILPDDWQLPAGLSFTPNTDNATKNQYTYNQWAELENAGAVFIATSGYFNPKLGGMRHVGGEGHIRTNALSDNGLQVYSVIKTNKIIYSYSGTQEQNLQYAFAQRLVHDTIVPRPEPEYMDLGLSVKWATFNVGATSPEDYGDYFAWGETEPKQTYSWENYKWCDGTQNTMTKYNATDGKTILEPADDAAQVHWGGNWRMPTKEEIEELIDNCTWSESTENGVKGYVVTSKHTGNSIFFPYSGYFNHDNSATLQGEKTLFYTWSSEHSDNTRAYDIHNRTGAILLEQNTRRCGFPIRPVYDDIPDPCLAIKVNDTLSINLMCVEGGTFTMGAMEGDTQAKENERPAHEVTLTYDYLIMQTEVTQGLWEAVMGEDIYDLISKSSSPTAKPISTRGDFPVGYVQLSQCLEFIDRLNALTGLHFRMPTEAEWEYAARGGNQSKGYLYAGSNTLTQVAQTSLGTVAKLRPNELGIYDMSGNIAEMTLDYLPNHDIGYPSANAQVNPRQISPTGNRAIRGLRWNTTEINCRISHRNAYTTTYSGNGMGFRLVLSEEQDFRTIYFNGSYFDMSFVKGGTFKMGSDAPDAEADERPVHEVTLSDYYIGQTEVTQHLWKKVMGDENNPSATKGNNLPVTNITWDEAQTFVERLSELTGMRFRLPTEAEWEYAARGGQKSKGYTYAGSNDIDEVGWYNGNSSNKTHSVAQKQPNELGIYDMTGNVWEYCSDWHMPYSAQAQTNPTGAATGEKPVLRGGCYHYDSKNCTNTNRHSYYTPDKGGASTGLRIVLEVDK